MMTDPVRGVGCDICGRSSIVLVNGIGACLDHLDDVIPRVLRLLVWTKDVPLEHRAEVAAELRQAMEALGRDLRERQAMSEPIGVPIEGDDHSPAAIEEQLRAKHESAMDKELRRQFPGTTD